MLKSLKIFISICFMSAYWISTEAQMTHKSEIGPFLLKNATIHTVTRGDVVGDIRIVNESIAEIGSNLDPKNAKVIDCTGKHIYPGFIDAGTHLGLGEIGAVSVTNDFQEIGDFIPQMDALTAVNPNAVAIPVTRLNGVTTVITYPTGGRWPGKAAMIDLHGYTPKQMYAGFKGTVLNFPSSGRRGRFDKRTDDEIKKDSEKAMKDLNDTYKNAVLFSKIDSAALSLNMAMEGYNPGMRALIDVVCGKELLMVEVNKEEDIKNAIKWIKDNKLNAVITGAKEGWRLAKELAEAGIAVVTGPVIDTPGRDYDRYDAAYANAGKMALAGVKVCLRTDNTENVRNLPFNAGFAAAYGMGKEMALKAITINPAEIFGLGNLYGSIEKGKVANLLISDGDPFETKTNIEKVFIRGYKIPMESRHTLLYDEFLNREPGLK